LPLHPSAHGSLNRKELARQSSRMRASAASWRKFFTRNSSNMQHEIKNWRASGRENGAVIIPLLLETGVQAQFDAIICVACSAASQFERLRERGWSHTEIKRRLEAQWPVEEENRPRGFRGLDGYDTGSPCRATGEIAKNARTEASVGN